PLEKVAGAVPDRRHAASREVIRSRETDQRNRAERGRRSGGAITNCRVVWYSRFQFRSLESDRRVVAMKRATLLRIVLSVGLLGAASFVLYRELSQTSWAELSQQLRAIPLKRLLLVLVLALTNYAQLTCYDVFALRYIRQKLPYSRIALASFIATA